MEEWNDVALAVCTAYNSIEHTATGFTPFEMMNGRCNPIVFQKFSCDNIVYGSNNELVMQRIAAQQRLICDMTRKQMVVFEATARRYSGKPNPFQVDDWVYRLLPVAVANVSRKMQVSWVGPFQVTRIIHQCQVEIRVEGKLVVAHVGHLVKATGDRPKIVPLRDVTRYLTQNGFPNQQSQEFLDWQWPSKTVEVR